MPPTVNESYLEFGVVPETGDITFGLSAIKNVGMGAIEAIVEAREAGGKFSSVEDFAKRVSASQVNRKVWEALIKCGAMDDFGDRSQLLYNLDMITNYASKAQKNALSGQIDIFGSMGVEDSLPALKMELPPTQVSSREQLGWERELLGLYLSSHPLEEYSAYLDDNCVPIKSILPQHEGRTVKIGGMTTTVRKITTKTGGNMAFVGVEDRFGDSLELIVFPKAYEKTVYLWEPDTVIEVSGKVNTKDRDGVSTEEIKIMVDEASRIDYDMAKAYKHDPNKKTPAVGGFAPVSNRERYAKAAKANVEPAPQVKNDVPKPAPKEPVTSSEEGIVITLSKMSTTEVLADIKKILTDFPGQTPVYLVMPGNPPKKIKLPHSIDVSDELIGKLKAAVKDGNVKLSR